MLYRYSPVAAAGVLLLAACSDAATDPFTPSLASASTPVAEVTSSADDGAGSLRAAIETANAGDIHHIRVAPGVGTVTLATPLVYTGSQALTIDGNEIVIDGSALPDAAGTPALDAALVANGGGDLTLRDLTIHASTGNGILVDVPDTQEGAIQLTLDGVAVEASRRHGVLVNDQVDYFADPFTRNGGGSAADVRVLVRGSRIEDNGFAGLDFDGIRINEGGAGTLDATILASRFEGNGADGIELDERGEGDATFALEQVVIVGNGSFSSEDFDDGIDVDELGSGDLIGRFVQVTASANFEQGIDLNENNEGDLRVTMNAVTAEDNPEEGVEFEEDDDFEDFPEETWGGNLEALLTNVTANRNGERDGDAGLKVREKFSGNLQARIVTAVASDNAVSGIEVREGQGGAMDTEVISATARENAGAGLRLRGNGEAMVRALDAVDNADGNLVSEAGIELR